MLCGLWRVIKCLAANCCAIFVEFFISVHIFVDKHTNFPKGKSLACCSRQCGQRISESNRELGIFGGHFMLTLKFWSKIRTIPHYLEGHQLGGNNFLEVKQFPCSYTTANS